MNTITFSEYEATTTGLSTLSSGIGYNVEIKKEGNEWSLWAVATYRLSGTWSLSHIRIVGREDRYPDLIKTGELLLSLHSYIDEIMNKLLPSPLYKKRQQ